MLLPSRPYKPFKEDEKSIRNDEIFKIVFGSNDRYEQLQDFLEGILHRKITHIAIRNDVALNKIHADNKLMRLDILVEVVDENGKKEKINVEMQNQNKYNVIERSHTYASGIVYDSLKETESYLDIPKTIVIWILGYNMFKDGSYHEIARVKRDFNNENIFDKVEYHYIQLPKFLKQVKEIVTKEEQWLAYISNSLNKEELEELFKMNRSIEEINKIVDIVMSDDDVWNALNERILAKNLEDLKKKKAFEDGEKSEKIETAKRMLKEQIDIAIIVKATGLPEEEINKIDFWGHLPNTSTKPQHT